MRRRHALLVCAIAVAVATGTGAAWARRGAAAADAVVPPSLADCASCRHEATPEQIAEAIERRALLPESAEVLASLGYVVGGDVADAEAGRDDATPDRALVSMPVSRAVRRLVALDAAGLARRAAERAAGREPATAADVAAEDQAASAVRVQCIDHGVHRMVRDGLLLIRGGAASGSPLLPGEIPGGRMRITNLSGGDYTIRFYGPVQVDGLRIPPYTDIPVTGQVEVDVGAAPGGWEVQPRASAWPFPSAPSGTG